MLPPQQHTHFCGRGLLGFSDDYIPECPWLIDKSVHRTGALQLGDFPGET